MLSFDNQTTEAQIMEYVTVNPDIPYGGGIKKLERMNDHGLFRLVLNNGQLYAIMVCEVPDHRRRASGLCAEDWRTREGKPRPEIQVGPESDGTYIYKIDGVISEANYHNSQSAWAAARRPQLLTEHGTLEPYGYITTTRREI